MESRDNKTAREYILTRVKMYKKKGEKVRTMDKRTDSSSPINLLR